MESLGRSGSASRRCRDGLVSRFCNHPAGVDEHDEQEQQPAPEIYMDPSQLAGVWANWAQVSHSEHEFTLDFVRLDSAAPPPGRGIVVARVAVSPLFVTQLIDALTDNWEKYAEKAMPREMHQDDEPSSDS
jgi:hypothetical protein